MASGSVPQSTVVYVQGRASGAWKEIEIPGNRSRSRLLGVWLATIVQNWNPGNRLYGDVLDAAGDNNPGRENERGQGTLLLPSVSGQYDGANGEGNTNIIPGTLVLDNLLDGRGITLKTNEEDSEILDVRNDGLVLYRVNNEIFSAHIVGDRLSAPKLVVKGEDVPEVHWVFWSKAGTEPHSTAHTSARH